MLLDPIIAKYQTCKPYALNPVVSEYLHYIEVEPFYVSPEFSDVKVETSSRTLNPQFVLFSAPGATGKSALAKYISFRLGALYWNLSKLNVGTNSFAGSIVNAVSPSQYSSFIEDLNQARVLLAIDAFDEAEIISGRTMIGSFINDISKSLTNYIAPSVFLFARTESAQFIASFCTSHGIPFIHYEIGFFEEGQAKEFIKRSIVDKGAKPNAADIKCVDEYYDYIKSNISELERKSFLGYAPVLEAISKHIREEPNRMKLMSALKKQKDCVPIVMEIMKALLHREQVEKVSVAFQKKCEKVHPEFSDWDKIYSEKEQLVRLIHFILFNDNRYENYPLDFLPPQMIDEYQEVLDTFLQQHPFVRSIHEYATDQKCVVDFTGPAFRDFSLAILLVEDREAEANLYFEEFHNFQSGFYIPSQIFFDCYSELTHGQVKATHLPYLLESFRAKATAMEYPYMQCSEVPSEREGEYSAIAAFGMDSNAKVAAREEITLHLLFDSDIIAVDNLSNTTLDMPHMKVSIGKSGVNSHIRQSSIICKEIIWASETVTIESCEYGECLLSCSDNVSGKAPRFEIIGDNIKVSIPNVKEYYRLIPYRYDFGETSSIDLTKFVYGMRGILMEFRTDKKDTLAKNWEKIENVTVGSNPLRRKILEYLKDKKIIYLAKFENQYKIDIDAMRIAGISYSSLSQMRADKLKNAFEDFCSWQAK